MSQFVLKLILDIIYEKIQTYGLEPDIVIEAKLKEQAIFKKII